MTTFLFDANVLIALISREHVHHRRVNAWAAPIGRFAICAVVEGAWIRFAVRVGIGAVPAQRALAMVRERRGYEFWPDAPSYVDMALGRVGGHRQVTDTYLAELVRRHDSARFATLDGALAAAHPDVAQLVPEI